MGVMAMLRILGQETAHWLSEDLAGCEAEHCFGSLVEQDDLVIGINGHNGLVRSRKQIVDPVLAESFFICVVHYFPLVQFLSHVAVAGFVLANVPKR